jgi:hypothetical protein
MPVYRMQCTFQLDSAFPRDAVMITPHFNDHGVGTDPTNLANDLATGLSGWLSPTNSCEIKVKVYDAQGTVPVFPVASVTKNATIVRNTAFPRELAICLSYYSGNNRPRTRGRLYIPPGLISTTPTEMGLRPSSTLRTKIAALVPIFSGLGGVDVDWVVYSRFDDAARKVSNWWVDDEWDVQRRRGLRATARDTGTTSG